jgi:citrate lyase beta subunit
MPADRVRFHEKAESLMADEVILDLEDSIVPAGKDQARVQMVDSLHKVWLAKKTVAVRVNAPGTPWFELDVEAAVGCERVEALVIPKVESAEDMKQIEERVRGLGRMVELEPQIETAKGLERASEIAAASDWVTVLHFGPLDLAASLGTPTYGSELPEEIYVHCLIRTLTAARAAGCQVVDGPFVDVRDASGLERSSHRAAQLGLDGKWAIHPDQIATINAIFTPSDDQIERARSLVAAYEAAVAAGRGAGSLHGEMVDEATVRWAQATLARAKR